jgi:hypothetical protein
VALVPVTVAPVLAAPEPATALVPARPRTATAARVPAVPVRSAARVLVVRDRVR